MSAPRTRVVAIDAVRGLAMVVMALDHARDFLHADAMNFPPDDLAVTTPAIFLTRWVTHLCAPTFFFTAGLGARLRRDRGEAVGAVARYLWTRGVWLIAVELVVMRLAMNFTFDRRYPVLLIILWALGWSMVALAALVRLPANVAGGFGLALVLGHNLFDGVHGRDLGTMAPLWHVLHQPAIVPIGELAAVTGYPLVPWMGVMALGYWAGALYAWTPERRHRALVGLGLGCLVGFVALRLANGYGDPAPWAPRPGIGTLLSFLNTTKYPPSLIFLLMTLGPALLLLAWLDRTALGDRHLFVVFGRVPFAFYVAHFWVLHFAATTLAFARYGAAAGAFLWMPLPSMGGARAAFPPDLGVSLAWTYVAWLVIVTAFYLPLRWLAEVKARRREWWMGYV